MGNSNYHTIVFHFNDKYIIDKYEFTGFRFYNMKTFHYDKKHRHIFINISQNFNNLEILAYIKSITAVDFINEVYIALDENYENEPNITHLNQLNKIRFFLEQNNIKPELKFLKEFGFYLR